MKTLYITGCNAFIGTRLLDYFSKSSEYNVYGIRRGDNKVVDNIIYCDYEDCSFLPSVVERSCNIIHME